MERIRPGSRRPSSCCSRESWWSIDSPRQETGPCGLLLVLISDNVLLVPYQGAVARWQSTGLGGALAMTKREASVEF